MAALDWWVVGLYLASTLALGLWLARRASGGLLDFFVSGRSLPWWLAGTSMAATTFSVDTPLYVTGVVARRGIAGNWEWWAFALSHVLLIYLFARLWRRAEVVTDAELTEIRYGGTPAAVLRGARAFLFAVPINCIAIGYVMLAMRKVIEALGVIQATPAWLPGDERLWIVVGLSIFVLVYAGLSGLWGVVATDFVQFGLAMIGALLVAGYALVDIGGIVELKEGLEAMGRSDALRMVPEPGSVDLPIGTFLAYLGIQWWAWRRSDGGGEFVQRMSAARTEADAEKAAWLFNLLHYVIRAWPWILAALAALVIFPDLADPEMGYPLLMLEYLPVGVLGLVVASFVAAFMSTVSTQINWGASYVVNDLWARFVEPDASQERLVLMGRLASVLMVAIGGAAAFFTEDVGTVFRFVIAIGTGPGAVLILRWFWWRINAWAELAAMLAGFTIALLTYTGLFPPLDFGARLAVTAFGSGVVWITVMYLTKPESEERLEIFYRRVRPGGPGWKRFRERTGVEPETELGSDLVRTLGAVLVLFGLLFAFGGAMLFEWQAAATSALVAAAGLWIMRVAAGRLAKTAKA
ncbi:MAG: sodium:solute symporter family protein [Gemmatimonadota bacterium]